MSPRFFKDHYYHIYNHSIDGLRLCYTSENYDFLLGKIASSLWDYEVDLIAYCLMPNHYHFFVRQLSETSLSSWIQSIFNSYSQALNHQLQRHGTLFLGRAKRRDVDKDGYRIHLMRYIHYNPVDAKLVSAPELWPYSNYLEYIGKRERGMFNADFLRNYFSSPKEYKKFMDEYQAEKQLAEKMRCYLFKEPS